MGVYLNLRSNLRKIYFKVKKPRKLDFPEIISIELSVICNAKCKFCPHSQIREKDKNRRLVMPDSVFLKIIDGCVGKKELKMIKPTLYNEPFITPKFIDRLRYIRKKLPNVKIRIITNAALLDKKKADTVIDEGLCDEINFSLDASRKETFEKFKEISWQSVLENIDYFIKKNKETGHKITTIASFVFTDENKDQLPEFRKMWRGKIDRFHISTEVGLNRRKDFLKENTNLYCSQVFNRLNFLSDGRAVMCCADAFGEVIVGDVNKNTVSEIWSSEAFNKIRRLHLQGRKREIPLCSKCNEWA